MYMCVCVCVCVYVAAVSTPTLSDTCSHMQAAADTWWQINLQAWYKVQAVNIHRDDGKYKER